MKSTDTLRFTLALGLWALAADAPVGAQMEGAQFSSPGTPAPTRGRPSKDEFQDKLKDSPWTAGPLHIRPWLGLKDISLVETLNEQGEAEGEDFTLTAGAGLRGYLPIGQKVLWAAHALPEYVWWQDTDAKSRLNGRYGLGFFAFLNRLTIELSHRRIEQQRYFSSEIQTLTSSQVDASTLNLNLALTTNLSLFGLALQNETDNLEDESPRFAALDRTEEVGTIGLRYENSRGWGAEIAHIDRSDDFATEARNLSNSGTSQTAMLSLNRTEFGFRLRLTANDRETDDGSDFGTFTDTTGSLDVLWKPRSRLALLSYVRRNQAYSIDADYSQILVERLGGRIDFDLSKAVLFVFAETGEDDYTKISFDVAERLEDVTAYGASLQIDLKEISFRVSASRAEYDSNLDGFDREVSRLDFSVKLEAISRLSSQLVDRLSLGRSETVW